MITKPNKGDKWTREEMILVFNLYFKMPYRKMNHRNPMIQDLARIMGRTANSVSIRLSNFASCDPLLHERGIKGMDGHKKQCQPYWDEFFNNQENLVFESEKILSQYQGISIEEKFDAVLQDIPHGLVGEERKREVKTRVNQDFFRQIVLANYDGKCALTGIDIQDMLIASHIIPWAENKEERLNPENGICLSALYDRAFDKGYISFTGAGEVLISMDLKSNCEK